jgi:hypothetical protein
LVIASAVFDESDYIRKFEDFLAFKIVSDTEK